MTSKTLKDFFEVYRPKAPAEQQFVDKHVTIKHKDRNGNGDDVFKATNVKTIKRKADGHGYDAGDDEKVYEEVEELGESRFKDGYYVDKGGELSHSHEKPFNDSKSAVRFADKEEDRTGRVHTVTHVKGGKIHKQWQYQSHTGDASGWIPHSDYKGDEYHARTVKEDVDLLDEGLEQMLDEAAKGGSVDYKHYTFTTTGRLTGMGEGGVEHIQAHPTKVTKLGVPLDPGKSYGETRLVIAKNNQTGEKSYHHVYQSSPGTDNTKPLLSVRSVGKAPSHHAKHQNALKSYLAGKTSLKEAFGDLEMIDELSKDLLKRYSKKSSEDIERSKRAIEASAKRKGVSIETEYDAPRTQGQFKRQMKRYRGLDDADYKLNPRWPGRVPATECVEIGEALEKVGTYFNKSGDAMTLQRSSNDKKHHMLVSKSGNVVGSFHDSAENIHNKLKNDGFTGGLKEEALDEISKATAIDYFHKAQDQMRKNFEPGRQKVYRKPGVMLAKRKIEGDARVNATEEVDLEESMHSDDVFSRLAKMGALNIRTTSSGIVYKHPKTGREYTLRHTMKNDGHRTVRSHEFKQHAARFGFSEEVEDVDQIDELSKATLGRYIKSAKSDVRQSGKDYIRAKMWDDDKLRQDAGKMADKRYKGINKAVDRLTKEDIINRAIDKYVPEEVKAQTNEEKLRNALEGVRESHAAVLFDLFNSLNEDNQSKMLETASTREGVLELLDFAIQNRGE